MKQKILFLLLYLPLTLTAQYPPAAGISGSTAIPADSSAFVAWATDCVVDRGWQDISDMALGLVDFGEEEAAVGPAGENGIVSLGDGGSALLTFDPPISDGEGWDFAVFENGFPFGNNQIYLELALVEVSSDGIHFARFPASSLTDTSMQVDGFGGLEATQLNNLAGKYRALFGTPFDLAELANHNNLDINQITQIRLIDVVGSIDEEWASFDTSGRTINDPFPTPFPSSGFDLDAIGVIHQQSTATQNTSNRLDIRVFPNPIRGGQNLQLQISPTLTIAQVRLNNSLGIVVHQQNLESNHSQISIPHLPKGWYFLTIQTKNNTIFNTKISIQ